MLKKSLLFTTLLALNPTVFTQEEISEEQIIQEQTNTPQEEANTWTMSFSFKAQSFTQENWNTTVEKLNATVEAASQENSEINPVEATLSLLKELFALSANEDGFAPAANDQIATISFTMNKLNDDAAVDWEKAQTISKEITEELNTTGKIDFDSFAPKLRELTEIIKGSTSLQGNISMGVSPNNKEVLEKTSCENQENFVTNETVAE